MTVNDQLELEIQKARAKTILQTRINIQKYDLRDACNFEKNIYTHEGAFAKISSLFKRIPAPWYRDINKAQMVFGYSSTYYWLPGYFLGKSMYGDGSKEDFPADGWVAKWIKQNN